MAIQIRFERLDEDGKIALHSPFHPALPAAAKARGGTWDKRGECWVFDSRDEEAVRAIARSIFGTDGSDAPRLVTVQHRVTGADASLQALWFGGRQVAHRSVRDAAVRLGAGTVITSGDFPGSGGSSHYPQLRGAGTVLEVRDVPVSLVVVDDDTWIVSADEKPSSPSPLAGVSDEDLAAELTRRGWTVTR